jgi:hypothetical protein
MLPTFFFTNIAHGYDPAFAWDTNTESDIAGYYLYYKTGSSGAPYNGTVADEGNSPIKILFASLSDSENPEYTIHGLLKNETYYFVITAYDASDNESDYSNELCFGDNCVVNNFSSGEDTGASGGGGCFIATAAFGSKFEKQVQVISKFRDLYLINHKIGRVFINAYYTYSPPVAYFISKHDTLRLFTRWSLTPLIGIIWMLLYLGVEPTLLILFLLGSAGWLCVKEMKFYLLRMKI